MAEKENGVYLIKTESKQIKKSKNSSRGDWTQEPTDEFDILIKAAEESFTIGWMAEKIASKASTWFSYFNVDQNQKLKPEEQKLRDFLQSIDLELLFSEMFVTWNSFFEVIVWTDKLRTEHVLIESIRINTRRTKEKKQDWSEADLIGPYWYKQKDWTEFVDFDYQEIIHFKTTNFRSKYYGKSKFYKTIDQVVLLTKIDQFYTKLLNKWNIKTKLLTDKSWKLTDPQKVAIKTVITDAISGVEWSFNTAIVPADMWTLNLQDDTETNAFLEYRRDLIKSICVWCNFPYDLLISDSSNRSTSETALQSLNEDVILPLQKRVVSQIKEFLRLVWDKVSELKFSEDLLDKISFNYVDVTNEKEKMEVLTWYKKNWIIDANEARELSPYNLNERPDWNQLIVDKWNNNNDNTWIQKIEKTIASRYNKDFITKCQKDVQELWEAWENK